MYGKSIKIKYLSDYLIRRTAILFSVVLLIFIFSQAKKYKIRKAVNQWLRTAREFDVVIDFGKAIRDPQNHSRMAQEDI